MRIRLFEIKIRANEIKKNEIQPKFREIRGPLKKSPCLGFFLARAPFFVFFTGRPSLSLFVGFFLARALLRGLLAYPGPNR